MTCAIVFSALSTRSLLCLLVVQSIPKLKTAFLSEVLVASDKRYYRNMKFDNVLARQGSSFCNRARLNFQAFPLRDMKWLSRSSKDELSL